MPPTGTLQLFPSPQKWPQRTSSHRTILRMTASHPIAERMEAAKVNGDIHELVIRVDSRAPSPIEMPPPIHIPERAPPRCSTAPPSQRLERPRVLTPASSEMEGSSPRPSSVISPISAAVSSPDQRRVASPAFSECPTLVRSSSISKPPINSEQPQPLRSMFPRYNPTVSLSEQNYLPTQTSPTHIPREKISKNPYSPTFYTPYGSLAQGWRGSSSSATPYFTPASALESLWDVANGQSFSPSVQLFNLQMHRSKLRGPSADNDEPRTTLSFGPTQSLPFFSLTQSGPEAKPESVPCLEQEVLIRRHHPTQPTSIPIVHTTIQPPPPSRRLLAPTDQAPTSAFITTIYPKLAALSALDAAANSPAACSLAVMDPGATSPAARQLAEDVLRGAAERECCSLVWTRSAQQNARLSSIASQGSYSLHHPSLGVFDILHEGNFATSGPNPALSLSSALQQKPVITICNPAATMSPDPPNRSTTSLATTDSTLARLDLSNDSLILNVAAILHLGNKYLLDVAVAALLAVLVAEEKRAVTPEESLVFEAPPTASVHPSKARKVKRSPSNASKTSETQQGGRSRWWNAGGAKPEQRAAPPLSPPPPHQQPQAAPLPFTAPTLHPHPAPKKSKKGKKQQQEQEQVPYDIPSIATTLFEVLKFTAKAVVWILGLGLKLVGYGMKKGAEVVRERQEERRQAEDIEMGRMQGAQGTY